MIVYIPSASGRLYASPVFAELGTSWDVKSVVLDERGENLILLPLRNEANLCFNYFYIDSSLQDGWTRKVRKSGFREIIDDRNLLNALKRKQAIPAKDFPCLSLYRLPLPVETSFAIDDEKDVERFMTVCWGLHDATIQKSKCRGDDLTLYLDTTWQKHIAMTFHDVLECKNIDDIACILDSEFRFTDGYIRWEVAGYDLAWDGLEEGHTYVTARKITWELTIDGTV